MTSAAADGKLLVKVTVPVTVPPAVPLAGTATITKLTSWPAYTAVTPARHVVGQCAVGTIVAVDGAGQAHPCPSLGSA